MNKDDVATAFELIDDELAAVLDETKRELTELAKNERFAETKAVADAGEQLKAFRAKLLNLCP
jgi:hypothetical protein